MEYVELVAGASRWAAFKVGAGVEVTIPESRLRFSAYFARQVECSSMRLLAVRSIRFTCGRNAVRITTIILCNPFVVFAILSMQQSSTTRSKAGSFHNYPYLDGC